MTSLHQSFPLSAVQKTTSEDNCLSLYDRYGALAYGIILKIIPQPELAQTVLVDLFTSPEVKSYTESALQVSSQIIRLARTKALGARPSTAIKSLPVLSSTEDNLNRLVFELSFYEGYSVQDIAQKLGLPPANVLKMISVYFKQHPTSNQL